MRKLSLAVLLCCTIFAGDAYTVSWLEKGSQECEDAKKRCVQEYIACYGYKVAHFIQQYGPQEWFDKWPSWANIGGENEVFSSLKPESEKACARKKQVCPKAEEICSRK
ncbi:MAG: hypothetical protein LBD19_02225 [Endomicrobium sp.]|jgi:hypothetical protein|nr:hypothetical protein [Endomicrobium sp.]